MEPGYHSLLLTHADKCSSGVLGQQAPPVLFLTEHITFSLHCFSTCWSSHAILLIPKLDSVFQDS